MKVLEALIMAYGWQGGTIHQAIDALPTEAEVFTVYSWGYHAGLEMRHGIHVADYPVPVNSWDVDSHRECVTSYVRGLLDGIDVMMDPNRGHQELHLTSGD